MSWTTYYDAPTGLTLYAKPKPLVVSPWGDDVVTMTESGSTGEYAISGLADGIDYTVFIQSGGSPASLDVKDGSLFYRVPQSEIDAVKKLLEADRISVLVAGTYYERTLERGTSTQLIPDKTIKQVDGVTDLSNPITQRYGGSVEE